MFTKGDFHIHTDASDGKLSAEAVIKEAIKNGVDILAITDHDTTDGLESALLAGKKHSISVIPGMELSTIHNGETIHMLGYFKGYDYKSAELQEKLAEMKNFRISRAQKIVNNLIKYFQIEVNFDKLYKNSKGLVARPHIARAIIDAGYDYTWDYIFNNILSENSPAYIPNKKITVPEGISLLKKFNASVFLAHPVLIKKSSVEDLLTFDFDGIEGIYFLNSNADTLKFKELAHRYNKILSAGSDFHGIGNLDTKHGNIGDISLSGNELTTFLNKVL